MQLKKITNQGNSLMVERRSVKKYDTAVKISKETMTNIIDDALTAPSSFNLQPWRFVVIDSPEGKELIKPYMLFNQTQWETSSAIIAVYADIENTENVDKVLSANVEYDLMTPEYKDKLSDMITFYRKEFTEERKRNGAILDCGFVTMQ